MNNILNQREKIYNLFHNSNRCDKYFYDNINEDKYATYYTAMYLIQDSTESLYTHRENGFREELTSYIEFWGVLQTIIIQQDAITNLYKVLTETDLDIPQGTSWMKIRNIRNLYSGHPINKGENKKDENRTKNIERSFIGRGAISYDKMMIEVWNKKKAETEFRCIELGKTIDDYANEASQHLQKIVDSFSINWP